MSPSLYDIAKEGALIEMELIEDAGELTPELEQRISELLAKGADKLEAAAKVVRNLEAVADACETEAKRLTERAAGKKRNVERLKAMMLGAVDCAFNGKVKTPLFSIWGQTSASRLQIELKPDCDEYAIGKLAPWAVRFKAELNRKEIAERIKSGEAVPDGLDVTEQPGTRYLRIR